MYVPKVEKFAGKGQRELRFSLGQIKFEMLLRPPNGDDVESDWVYEAGAQKTVSTGNTCRSHTDDV